MGYILFFLIMYKILVLTVWVREGIKESGGRNGGGVGDERLFFWFEWYVFGGGVGCKLEPSSSIF